MSKILYLLILFIIITLFGLMDYAFAQQHKGINFQAVLKSPTGTFPTVSGLTATVQILTPDNCVLREEQHSNVNISNGYVNLVIGGPTMTASGGNNPGIVLNISEVFNNSVNRIGLNCVNGDNSISSSNQTYIPASSHARKMRLRVNIPGEGLVIADFNMRAIPFAVNAEQLDGKTTTDFIQVDAAKNVTQTNLNNFFSNGNFANINSILSGTYNAPTATSAVMATTATNVSGTVAIANGGTGATTQAGAVNALLPSQTAHAGKYLITDGTNVSWALIVSGGASGNAGGDLTGTYPNPTLTSSGVVAGAYGATNKTINSIQVDAKGRITNITDSLISLNGNQITAGTIGTGFGGTGLSSLGAADQILGMNAVATGYEFKSITAGTGISITNGNGSITVANTGLTGASPFSGDVSGTSTTTSVDKIKGKAVSPAAYSSGQVLRYDGTNWVNAVINAATDLTGTLAIANGGTGATTAAAARTNLGLGTVAILNRGSAAGNVPLLGVGGLVADKMCTADGTGSAIICSSSIPISSQWVTTAADIYYSIGRVGIGTSSPQVLLDIGDPVGTYPALTGPRANFFADLGSSPDNNHKNMFGLWDTQPSAADAGGGLAFGSRDVSGANQIGALIKTLRVSTASDWNHHLAFFTRNSGIVGERLRISDSGKVGIGTAAPSYTLHVVGTAGLSTGTAWTNASDRRLKDIHGNYEYGLNEILKLRTVRYNYKKNNPLKLPADVPMTGFIAQEVQKIIPDAVKTREDGYLELNVDPIHWATVNAVQDLHQLCKMSQNQLTNIEHRLKTHDREIASLKEENAKIKAENTMIKQALCELGKKNFCNQDD